MRPVSETLLSAVTTGTGTAVSAARADEHAFYITGSGTISAGAVQIETAPTADYSGTWAPLGAPVTVTAACALLSFSGALDFIRARVTTNIAGGGSVSVDYNGVE